jgi:hypothetical protein
MANDHHQYPLLQEALPELASEVTTLLLQDEEVDLADQVPLLRLVDRCRCGDYFCATVYTAAKPKGTWGPGHENISLDVSEGFIILDVVDRKITCIEVLYREDIRQKLLRALP